MFAKALLPLRLSILTGKPEVGFLRVPEVLDYFE
jgi:hypothetical protein